MSEEQEKEIFRFNHIQELEVDFYFSNRKKLYALEILENESLVTRLYMDREQVLTLKKLIDTTLIDNKSKE